MNITTLENMVIESIKNSVFDGDVSTVLEIHIDTNLSRNKIKGVIGSLIKKGIAKHIEGSYVELL